MANHVCGDWLAGLIEIKLEDVLEWKKASNAAENTLIKTEPNIKKEPGNVHHDKFTDDGSNLWININAEESRLVQIVNVSRYRQALCCHHEVE